MNEPHSAGLFLKVRSAYRAAAETQPWIRTLARATVIPAMRLVRDLRNVRIRVLMSRFTHYAKLRVAAEALGVIGVGKNARGREIVMLVVSDLRVDPRVEREARALAEAGYSVRVICPDPTQGQSPDLKLDWGPRIEINFIAWTAASYVMKRPGFFGTQLFNEAMRHSPFAFHAHDLNTSYVALAAARTTGANLVVDFHEWASENIHWDIKTKSLLPYPHSWKRRLQRLEARLLREASVVVTVCESIAEAMAKELGRGCKPVVVRNIPNFSATPTRKYPPLKEQFGISRDTFAVLYQGGTGPTRLLEPVIQALEYVPRAVLVIRGPLLEEDKRAYREIARKAGAADRLILSQAVPSRDVVAAARGADAGVWSLPPLCRNFTYALPNKLFEYISAGVPVIAADYQEARRLVEENKIGALFSPYEPKSIAEAINRMIDDPVFARRCRENTVKTLVSISAKAEWDKLVAIYDGLENRSD